MKRRLRKRREITDAVESHRQRVKRGVHNSFWAGHIFKRSFFGFTFGKGFFFLWALFMKAAVPTAKERGWRVCKNSCRHLASYPRVSVCRLFFYPRSSSFKYTLSLASAERVILYIVHPSFSTEYTFSARIAFAFGATHSAIPPMLLVS